MPARVKRTSEVGAFNETQCMGNDIETGNYLSVETCRLHTFDDFMKEETNSRSKWSKGGRPIKNDPAKNCVMVRFSDQEYAKFLSMYEESGVYAKSIFVKARVFNESFRVIKTDEGTLKYVAKLTQLHAQFRAVGVNYNQVVKQLKSNFSEQKALALLYKLEIITLELVTTQQKIIALCEEFKQRFF